ncbi:hypothetical protein V5R04_08955 [Jonesiaceae bacterium BS-20]|uniref:DUF6891 domain-containing protein n=1 Tax=Jonesiaceae bacterium BS-20 TaxID=3120821 RepID=A0AAU7DSU6_9MICO
MVLSGADRPEDYWDYIEEELTEAGIKEEEARTFLKQVIADRIKQQEELGQPESAWTNAFAELAEIGVVARENFTCCGTCGSTEIWNEHDESRQWRGYLYYHSQVADAISACGS